MCLLRPHLALVRLTRERDIVSQVSLQLEEDDQIADVLSRVALSLSLSLSSAAVVPPDLTDVLSSPLSHLVQMVRLYEAACHSPFGLLAVTAALMAPDVHHRLSQHTEADISQRRFTRPGGER